MEIKSRRFARKKEIGELRKGIEERFPPLAEVLGRKEKVEVAGTTGGYRLFLIEGKPYFFELEGEYYPLLRAVLTLSEIHSGYVVVDQGAIPHVVNGADIMRPGVVEVSEDVTKGGLVVVLEEKHGKPIALGISLWDYSDFQGESTGKCIENIHYVGDRLWEMKV